MALQARQLLGPIFSSVNLLIFLILLIIVSIRAGAAESLLISGEVAAQRSQKIIAPMSANWNLRLDWMAEEGSELQTGDAAVRFDNSGNDSQIIQVTEKTETTLAEGERSIARLEKEAALAVLDRKIAAVRQQLAENEARIEAKFIGELNYADNQLALSRARQASIKAGEDAASSEKKLKEARLKLQIDQDLANADLQWFKTLSAGNTVKAEMDGFILYKNHPWSGSKFRAGDNVQTSFLIAEIVDTSQMYIRLMINAVDRTHLETDQAVSIYLDAYPGKTYRGHITEMLVQGEARKQWGKGLYMQGRVEFDPDQSLPTMLPGMGALVEVDL